MQWLKDWGPIVAPMAALLGVLVTVSSASRTYRRGQAEIRKDRQRALVAELIIGAREFLTSLEIFVMVAGKFKRHDLAEWVDTDSGKRYSELSNAVREGLVRALCEIRDPELRPLIIRLAVQIRTVMEDGLADSLHDDKLSDEVRFKAVLAALRRVRTMNRTCEELELAAINVLPVEIDVPPLLRGGKRSQPAKEIAPPRSIWDADPVEPEPED